MYFQIFYIESLNCNFICFSTNKNYPELKEKISDDIINKLKKFNINVELILPYNSYEIPNKVDIKMLKEDLISLDLLISNSIIDDK